MRDKIFQITALVIAFINLYIAGKQIIKFKMKDSEIESRNIVFTLSLSIVSTVYIFQNIKQVGDIAFLIAPLSGLLIFFTSVVILGEENKRNLGKE